MPRQEEPVPWMASQAATYQQHPRKNVYFVGPGMDELFDYCIWQAHVKKHLTVFGKQARNSPAFILDVLARDYLKTMRETGNLENFRAWRSRYTGQHDGISFLLMLAMVETLALLPTPSDLAGSLKEWKLGSKEYQQLRRFCDIVRKQLRPKSEQRNAKAS